MEIQICPHWLLCKFGVPEELQRDTGILISSVLIFLSVPILIHLPHLCLAQQVLGIPCPGCGVTHSILALLQFRFHAAWDFNPGGIVVAAYFGLQICWRTCVLSSLMTALLVARLSRAGEILVMVVLFGVWFGRLFNY
ncbi:MAG: DUF2752 domain-containing protein [Terriglobales bacterium]